MRKRIYSILLAIAMLATIIPITVLAEDPPHTHNGYTAISNATELATLFTNGGSGYLTADITTNSDASRLIKAGTTVNLCLNGFVLTLGYNNNQNIGIEGNGVLNLYDCGTKTHKFSVGANGLWTLDETSGTETVTGGVITGGQGGSGIAGAVYMASGAIFNMYGGNIIGNQASGNCGAVYVDGTSVFNMIGGNIIGNQASGICGAVYVDDTSVFNMSGGTIAGNIAGGLSGAIHITASAVFNLSSGTIDSNKSNSWGGAVCSYGTFNMTGGAITNNTSTQGGGGISISDNSTFSMSGGEISGCISGNEGGGACIGRDGVNLRIGGTAVITGNKRNSTTENLYLRTGGTSRLRVNTPAEGMSVGITMQTPGQFTNTTATSSDEQYFTSDNASYFVSFNSGNYLELVSGTPVAQIGGTKYTTLNAAIKAAGVVEEAKDTNATTIKLLANITNEGTFNIGNFNEQAIDEKIQNIVLDLNGFTISDTASNDVLFIIGGYSKLTIDDLSEGKTGAITAKGNTTKLIRGFDVARGTLVLNNGKISDFSLENNTDRFGAGVSVWTNGTFIMNGGEISNCAAKHGGAVDSDGAFTLNGGNITNNRSTTDGAGVFIGKYSSFTMNKGTISGNTATANGGGIFIDDSIFIMNGGTISGNTGNYGGGVCGLKDSNSEAEITMNGGTISGNTGNNFGGGVHANKITFNMSDGTISENTAPYGAGLDISNSGTFNMFNGSIDHNTADVVGGAINANGNINIYGGEIANNEANSHSGGICFSSGNITLGGTAKIINNVVGSTTSNVQIMSQNKITIGTEDNAPKSGMSVGITMQTPGQFTTTSATSGDEQYFTSDDTAYAVAYKPDGFLKLELTYTVTFDTDGGSAIDAQEVEVGGVVTQPTNPTKEGYTFFRWLDKDGKPFDFRTPITEDITLKASWLMVTYSVKFYRCVGDETPFCFYNVSYNNTIGNAPNPTRKDYIFKGWYYNGKPFDFNTKVTCDMDVYAEWEAIAHDYKITEGAHALWLPRYEKGFLSFRSNADYSKFVSVEVDNKILDASKFIASPGSTIVKLKPEYLSTLAIGKHTLRIVSTDGYAETDFYIEDETIAPTDGRLLSEATMSTAFVGMGIVGLSAVFYVGKKKKLRK